MSSELPTGQNNAGTQRIVAFAGSMESGKNAACNFVGGLHLVSLGLIEEFRMLPDGGMEVGENPVNLNDIAPQFVKMFSFADVLKEVIHKIFNIPLDDLYSREGKSKLTNLYWENMPGVSTNERAYNTVQAFLKKKKELSSYEGEYAGLNLGVYHPPGQMTVREVLQYFGTDICRSMYTDCWNDAIKNKIMRDSPALALISDTRFDNEVESLVGWGAYVVKLTRQKFQDGHVSESGLTWDSWDAVINNQDLDFRQFNKALYEGLKPIGVFNPLESQLETSVDSY